MTNDNTSASTRENELRAQYMLELVKRGITDPMKLAEILDHWTRGYKEAISFAIEVAERECNEKA